MTEVFNNQFYRGFEALQSHSNEKQIYVTKFTDYIDRYSVSSLLDIGAGDGKVAIPISNHVESYVAVERNPEYAGLLRSAGKLVVEELFPTEIEHQYDLVVMSHVISHVTGNYVKLVPPAWELVKSGGHLLIVTNQDVEPGDWSQLLDSIGLGYPESTVKKLGELITHLQGLGKTDIQRVSSQLTTDSTQGMIDAMAFLAASGGNRHYDRFMEKANLVAQIIESQYRAEEKYIFPLIHPFISTHKTAD